MKEREIQKHDEEKIIQTNQNKLSINHQNIPEARDVLKYFNEKLHPIIESKYKSILNPRKRWLLELFGKKQKTESDIYKERWIESANTMTEFIIDNDTHNIIRIKLLLEVIRLEMWWAYGNIYLDYTYAAEEYEKRWEHDKAKIIKHCLKILSTRFRDKVATIAFTWDYIIVETRKEKTLIHKDDFFKKD